MTMLRRHQLVRLSAAGWDAVIARAPEDATRACLAQWAARGLPLVVTRQPALDLDDGELALGLPAPLRWERRRIALRVPASSILAFDAFPIAHIAVNLLPAEARASWLDLMKGLDRLEVDPRLYGSFGWQQLTGLLYLHERSDIDLLLSVRNAHIADRAAALLHVADVATPRLDAELVFADDSAVAWREWLQWRAHRVDRILVKRLHGASLESGETWLGEAAC